MSGKLVAASVSDRGDGCYLLSASTVTVLVAVRLHHSSVPVVEQFGFWWDYVQQYSAV